MTDARRQLAIQERNESRVGAVVLTVWHLLPVIGWQVLPFGVFDELMGGWAIFTGFLLLPIVWVCAIAESFRRIPSV